MTARALCGLLVLHGMYLAVGGSVLLSLRGWSRWRSAVRLAGLAYLLGVATLGIAWTLLLVVGVPFGPVTIVVSSLVVVGAGLFVRRRRGGVERPPEASSRGSRGLPGLVTVIGIVAAGGYLVALFRVARLNGLFSFDGWAFWVTRGKAVYFFDGFDEQVFSAVPHPSYPPVIPILDAAAFHAMGSADVVTLHVQYWFLGRVCRRRGGTSLPTGARLDPVAGAPPRAGPASHAVERARRPGRPPARLPRRRGRNPGRALARGSACLAAAGGGDPSRVRGAEPGDGRSSRRSGSPRSCWPRCGAGARMPCSRACSCSG